MYLQIEWDTQYLVTAVTSVGQIYGMGWYGFRDNATLSISPIQSNKDLFTNYVFEGWKAGDIIVSTSPSYSFTVTGPVSLAASWKTELNLTTVGAVGAGILLIAGIAFFAFRRGKTSPVSRPDKTPSGRIKGASAGNNQF